MRPTRAECERGKRYVAAARRLLRERKPPTLELVPDLPVEPTEERLPYRDND